jgi:hypothetical protein
MLFRKLLTPLSLLAVTSTLLACSPRDLHANPVAVYPHEAAAKLAQTFRLARQAEAIETINHRESKIFVTVPSAAEPIAYRLHELLTEGERTCTFTIHTPRYAARDIKDYRCDGVPESIDFHDGHETKVPSKLFVAQFYQHLVTLNSYLEVLAYRQQVAIPVLVLSQWQNSEAVFRTGNVRAFRVEYSNGHLREFIQTLATDDSPTVCRLASANGRSRLTVTDEGCDMTELSVAVHGTTGFVPKVEGRRAARVISSDVSALLKAVEATP